MKVLKSASGGVIALTTAFASAALAATLLPSAPHWPVPLAKTAPSSVEVGVYYFPGWLDSPWAPAGAWGPIKPFTDRKPLLGWYNPSDVGTIRQQLSWMADYGIGFVAMDWYFSHGEPRLTQGIDAYLAVNQKKVKLSLLWANHDDPVTPKALNTIVQYWVSRYFASPSYLRVDGKPVVFVFSYDRLEADARASGSTIKSYVDTIQEAARSAGLPGVYLVAGTDDTSVEQIRVGAPRAGFSAVSAYNWHRKPASISAADRDWARPFRGYGDLQGSYKAQWEAAMALPIPFIVPMSAGWDRRPWGGSDDPLHDQSIGTPAEFLAHLQMAKAVMNRPGPQRSGLGVICCWNEFGEGSFIEPTTADRFSRLEQVRRVFGR